MTNKKIKKTKEDEFVRKLKEREEFDDLLENWLEEYLCDLELGRFSDELWSWIQSLLTQQTQKHKAELEEQKERIIEIVVEKLKTTGYEWVNIYKDLESLTNKK